MLTVETNSTLYMVYQMAATAVKVIHRLQAFLNAIRRTFLQHFTRFQPTVCSRLRYACFYQGECTLHFFLQLIATRP